MDAPAATEPKTVPAPQPVKAADQGTEYLVLTEAGEKDSWKRVASATARTAEAAIKQVVGGMGEATQAGTYVAAVASRWQPVKVAPKVERSLELKPVKP